VDRVHNCSAARASRRQSEIERGAPASGSEADQAVHSLLVARNGASHKRIMPDLFDMELRARRRDRAARSGPELFLLDRAFDDCLERIVLMGRHFRKALLIGCPDPRWPPRLRSAATSVDVRDPGPLFASAAGGAIIIEDRWAPPQQRYDLVVALGTLDSVNDLPLALRLIRIAMAPGGLLIGAISGGNTLPRLRAAMRAADAVSGTAVPHVHPRIEPAALAPLLADAQFVQPVVDIDRAHVRYASFDRLIADLRRMGATNILQGQRPPCSRAARKAAAKAFKNLGEAPAEEVFELLHFAAWTPNG
jgi:hypothetical protein